MYGGAIGFEVFPLQRSRSTQRIAQHGRTQKVYTTHTSSSWQCNLARVNLHQKVPRWGPGAKKVDAVGPEKKCRWRRCARWCARGGKRLSQVHLCAAGTLGGRSGAEKKAAGQNISHATFPLVQRIRVYCPQKPHVCVRWGSGVSLRNSSRVFLFTCCVMIPMVLPCPQQDEGEEQKCCEESAREGKRRVFGAGQAAATAVGHHQSTGQSVHHPPHHQLPQNETRLSRWWVCAYTRLICFFTSHIVTNGKKFDESAKSVLKITHVSYHLLCRAHPPLGLQRGKYNNDVLRHVHAGGRDFFLETFIQKRKGYK